MSVSMHFKKINFQLSIYINFQSSTNYVNLWNVQIVLEDLLFLLNL